MRTYKISLWPPFIHRKKLQELEVEFLGWKDKEMEKKYLHYVSYFETESWDGRAKPSVHEYGIQSMSIVGGEKDGGTPIGTRLVVYYDEQKSTVEKIFEFFDASPFLVKRV